MTALVLVTPPASEPLTIAEVMLHCRLDQSNQELAPGTFTAALASPAAAGSVTAGAHRFLATFVTADGETEAGVPTAAVTVVDAAVNGRIALSAIPVGGSSVTARKIYMTAAGGSTYLLATTIANNTDTTATINVADASLGVGAPAVNTTSDSEISALVRAARTTAESKTRRALVTQTWDLILDRFPCWEITLPKSPVQSVTSITYVDDNGQTQTLDSAEYLVDTSSAPGRITPAFGKSWPVSRWQNNAVTIRFVCGYGSASDVPAGIKQWMLVRIKHFVDNKGPVVVGTISSEFPRSFVDGLLDDFIAPSYAWAAE